MCIDILPHQFKNINTKSKNGGEICMLAQWIAELVGQMHKWKISKKRLADHMGLTPEYVSMVLNGHREPAGAKGKFRRAVDEIVASLPMTKE